jgi:hypothetical protein
MLCRKQQPLVLKPSESTLAREMRNVAPSRDSGLEMAVRNRREKHPAQGMEGQLLHFVQGVKLEVPAATTLSEHMQ